MNTQMADSKTEAVFNDELLPGTALLQGQYTVEEFLNSGGFGMTYFARDSLNRTVVIKECFPASFCCRSDAAVRPRSRTHQKDFRAIVQLFVREARQLAKLDHPNIVGVHQVFEDNETAYMALDCIDGQDLLDIIDDKKQKLSPDQVRRILLKILDAVAYVHDMGVLHRDISPDNILLDGAGQPILIDFGAAREKASRASRALSALMVVKDGYSPQEFYVNGSDQGPASDLYSLAATFYHVLTGDPPPNSQTRVAAIAAKQDDPYEKLAGRIEGYDRDFLSAIDQALHIFPKDRIQNARDWIIRIDTDKRVEQALAIAERDRNMNRTISQLVTETNKAVENAIAHEQREAAKRASIAAKPAPKPKPEFVSLYNLNDVSNEEETAETAPDIVSAPAPKTDHEAQVSAINLFRDNLLDPKALETRPAILSPKPVGFPRSLLIWRKFRRVSAWKFGSADKKQSKHLGRAGS